MTCYNFVEILSPYSCLYSCNIYVGIWLSIYKPAYLD